MKAAAKNDTRLGFASVPLAVRSVRTDAEHRAGAGEYIRIRGHDLAFKAEDSSCGVFFVDGSAARSPDYEIVSENLVVARVPEGLSAGPYLLRLRRPGDGGYRELGSESVFIVE
jgi:hypothetical protein